MHWMTSFPIELQPRPGSSPVVSRAVSAQLSPLVPCSTGSGHHGLPHSVQLPGSVRCPPFTTGLRHFLHVGIWAYLIWSFVFRISPKLPIIHCLKTLVLYLVLFYSCYNSMAASVAVNPSRA